MSASVLGYPDCSRPFDLQTDASLQGLGTVYLKEMIMAEAGLLHMPVGSCHPLKEQCKSIVQPS